MLGDDLSARALGLNGACGKRQRGLGEERDEYSDGGKLHCRRKVKMDDGWMDEGSVVVVMV